MCKKMIYLTLFVLVLSLVGNVQAADVFWTDAGPAHLWSTPANWDTGAVPTSSDTIWIGVLPGPTIANQGAVASKLFVGQTNAPGDLTVNGGTVTITSPLQMGRDADSDGTLYMISGTINADNDLYVAAYSDYILRTYAAKMGGGGAAVNRFDVIKTRVHGTKDFLVYCVVTRAGGEPLRLVWRLRQRDGRYRIIDLMVEGVSLVQTQRQEFVSFIRANGGSVDKLIAELRQRTI